MARFKRRKKLDDREMAEVLAILDQTRQSLLKFNINLEPYCDHQKAVHLAHEGARQAGIALTGNPQWGSTVRHSTPKLEPET